MEKKKGGYTPQRDKSLCWTCKYHTLFNGNIPDNKKYSELTDLQKSSIACYRSVVTGETCMKSVGKKLVDSRGDDMSKCKLWEKDDRANLKACEKTFGKWVIT